MSNYDALALYLVADGEASLSNPDADWDGVNSILVAATSGDAALMIADAYEAGRIGADNLSWEGRTIWCVCMRDRETGDYL